MWKAGNDKWKYEFLKVFWAKKSCPGKWGNAEQALSNTMFIKERVDHYKSQRYSFHVLLVPSSSSSSRGSSGREKSLGGRTGKVSFGMFWSQDCFGGLLGLESSAGKSSNCVDRLLSSLFLRRIYSHLVITLFRSRATFYSHWVYFT